MFKSFGSLKFVLVAIAVVVSALLGHQVFRSAYDQGYQRGADSVGVAVAKAQDVALTRVRDSLRVALGAGRIASRDTDSQVRLTVQSRNDRVARLHSTPIATVAVVPAVDSLTRSNLMAVRIAGSADTTSYLVHVVVGNWMIGAQEHILAQNKELQSDSVLVNVTFPGRLAAKEHLLNLADSTIARGDSLAALRLAENDALRRRVAALTPSRIEKGERILTYALATYGAVEGGRRLFGGK